MFKGYRNHISNKNYTNKNVTSLPQVSKCSKCHKLNPIFFSPALHNTTFCIYCGNPFYIIKSN